MPPPPRSTASVSAPSDGAGRVAAGSSPSNRNTPPSIVIDPSPGCSTSWSRPFARACSSACTDSRASTGPAGTAAEPSRASHASTGSVAIASLDRRRDALLLGEHGRVVGHEIRRRDRRVLEPEEPEERLPLREVETGDREEAVGRLVAAVVRVHREAARDLVGAGLEIAARRGSGRPVGLAVEPDEILDLHRERGTEERHLDEPTLSPAPRRDERGEHAGREQVPGREIGHRESRPRAPGRVSPREACEVRSPERPCATRS